MQSETKVLVLFALVAVAYCNTDAPKPCCFDTDQYEAYYGGSVGYYSDSTPGSVSELFQLAVDVSGGRVGTDGYYYYSAGYTLSVKTIQLYKEGKQYTIVNNVCTVQPISTAGAPKKCLPDDAVFNMNLIQGVDELSAVSWVLNLTAEGLTGPYYLSVSSKTCAPLGASFNGVTESEGQQVYMLSSGGFFNITKGIKNPDKYFTVPSSCKEAVPKLKIENEKMDFIESLVGTLSRLRVPF